MNTERKLYQWDTGQKLVGCTGLYVDFPIGNEVYRVETADGMCIIPDELLQTSGGHKVYECMTNNTIRSFAFSVTPRPQPPDYVFTPTERLTFEGLVQKVDDAVADMIRRAESGEFDGHTPVKGTDYFTTAEIQQIQNEVSSGAIGEFKSVVDTETETFNNNAETKLNAYNQNDSQKTTAYNANATQKLNAYNANANNRVAEFDSHTERIQTDISGLKNDLVDLEALLEIETESIPPTEYYTFPNTGKGVASDGTIYDSTGADASDYIELKGLYGICRVVSSTAKYNLSRFALYDKDKNFIKFVSPLTDYEFATFNDATVAWLPLQENAEKNAVYVRFDTENFRGFNYWVVKSKEIVRILDNYLKKEDKFYKLKGKTIVNFGDSIFGNKRPPTDISTKLAEITGATVYNIGFGGCRMCRHNGSWDAFSMYQLANAISSNDFSLQDAVDVASESDMPSYFAETRELLKSINFNDVDIITIAYGTNDFSSSRVIDSDTEPYNIIYFGGALRHSIETILTAYPHLKIFICGQTYRFWMDSSNEFIDDSDTHTNSDGNTLIDYINKTKEIANEYHIPFIDNYYDLGINKFNRSHWFPSNDGTHHNELGGKLIAEHMANELY